MGKNEPHRADDARAEASHEADLPLTDAFAAIEKAADKRGLKDLLHQAREAHDNAPDDKGNNG